LVDPPASGAWNMAVDEALVDDAAERGHCWLRFYGWAEPTLSLGYFQGHAERQAHRPSRQCPMVRRASGGGAILHDAEITYCLAIPHAHALAADSTWLYTAVHEALVEALYAEGLEAIRCTAEMAAAAKASGGERPVQPFLCFQRRAAGDVLLGGAKICGSAQRRPRGAILQHGSLILERSPQAPELPGLADQAGKKIDPRLLIPRWTAGIGRRLHWNFSPASLDPALMDAVRTLALEKYSAESWTCRR
jgi:lipoate-protein ligase A